MKKIIQAAALVPTLTLCSAAVADATSGGVLQEVNAPRSYYLELSYRY